MRASIVIGFAVVLGACASIVGLDNSDPPPGAAAPGDDDDTSTGTSSGTSGTTNSASGSTSNGTGTSTSSGQTTTSSSSGTSGSTTSSSSSSSSSSGVVVPSRCDKVEDCPASDDDHDRCNSQHKCVDSCLDDSITPCFPDSIPGNDARCCIGKKCVKIDPTATFSPFHCVNE